MRRGSARGSRRAADAAAVHAALLSPPAGAVSVTGDRCGWRQNTGCGPHRPLRQQSMGCEPHQPLRQRFQAAQAGAQQTCTIALQFSIKTLERLRLLGQMRTGASAGRQQPWVAVSAQ